MPDGRAQFCSFCGVSRGDLRFLMDAPGGVAICGDCITVAVGMMAKGEGLIIDALLPGEFVIPKHPFEVEGPLEGGDGSEAARARKPK